MDGLEWPANYKKGDKPIEGETGTTHDYSRCQSIQKKDGGITKSVWLEWRCQSCGVVTHYSRKHYTIRTIPKPCRECKFKSFNSLDNYGITL